MTLKDYNDRPETRVFRLDTECYIVYLGDNGNDYKPFLRIGNTQDLPQTIIANTQNIVITDRLTGNPALETANIYDMYLDEIRYLGDPDLVEHFRSFVRKANLHVQAFDEYTGAEESSANASYVYFYTDGNMSVYFGRNKIFTLRDRERLDGHFIERAKRIRSLFIKNQLRYRVEDFRGPGFIIIDGSVSYFLNGRIVVPALSPSFFSLFAEVGVDPDLIHVVLSDSLTESLIDLFKRKRSKQDQIVVVTTNPELVSSAAGLFAIKKQEALDARVVDFTSGKCELDDLRLHRTAGGLAATYQDLGITLQPGTGGGSFPAGRSAGEETGVLAIDSKSGIVTLQRGRHTLQRRVLMNTPHAVRAALPDSITLFHRYFELPLPFYADLLPSDLGQVVKLVHGAVGGLMQGKERVQVKLADSRLHDLTPPLHPYVRNFLITAESALRMIKNGESGFSPMRAASSLAATISHILPNDSDTKSPEYFVGEICIGRDDIYLFYRPVKVNVTQNQVESAEVLTRRIVEESVAERVGYATERERLLSLIQELDIPQTRRGPGPARAAAEEKAREEKRRLEEESLARSARTAEERRMADKSSQLDVDRAGVTRQEEKIPAASARSLRQEEDRGRGAASLQGIPVSAVPSGKKPKNRWLAPLAAAAAVVILIGALLFFLLRIGRGGRPSAVARERANGSQSASETGSTPAEPSAEAARTTEHPESAQSPGGTVEQGNHQKKPSLQPKVGEQQSNQGAVQQQTTTPKTTERQQSASQTTEKGQLPKTPAESAAQPSTSEARTSSTSASQTPSVGSGSANAAAAPTTSAAAAASAPGTTNGGSNATAEMGSLYVDGIRITLGDILHLANSIAATNGLPAVSNQDLGLGGQPSRIHVGMSFIMPDGSHYTVKKGDTVWSVTVPYIRGKLGAALRDYHALLMQYDLESRVAPVSYRLRQDLIAELQKLPAGVFSENFARMIQGMINEIESS